MIEIALKLIAFESLSNPVKLPGFVLFLDRRTRSARLLTLLCHTFELMSCYYLDCASEMSVTRLGDHGQANKASSDVGVMTDFVFPPLSSSISLQKLIASGAFDVVISSLKIFVLGLKEFSLT